jgi:hypothetical protein
VVVHDIHQLTLAVAELSESLDARFEAVDRRFEAVDRRFDALEKTVKDGNAALMSAILALGRNTA